MPNVTSSFYSTEHWSTAAAEGLQTPSPVDDDTRVVVKHRCTGQRVTPTSSQDYYCNSPPANQEAVLPWGAVELSESESESDYDDGWIIRTPPLIITMTSTKKRSLHPPLTRTTTTRTSRTVLLHHHHSRKVRRPRRHQRQHQRHCTYSR